MDMSERYRSVTAAAASLRLVYGPNAAKKIARRFGVAVVTAKVWLGGRVPVARRREIAQAIMAQCDEVEQMLNATRHQWRDIADEAPGDLARGQDGEARAPARRVGR